MTTPKDEYRKLKTIEQLKGELLKAFVKNAALRARKMRLESELGRIAERLKANDAVQEVLARKEFQGLEISESAEFLRDIEQDAVSAYRRRKQKAAGSGNGSLRRKRSSDADKKELLLEIVRDHKGEEFFVRDIGKCLLDRGISTPATSWLKSLDIPAAAMPDVQKGNRRAGKRFIPSKVKWLLEDGVVAT
jgi:hypothetical protein